MYLKTSVFEKFEIISNINQIILENIYMIRQKYNIFLL